jgi:hypothetical protein
VDRLVAGLAPTVAELRAATAPAATG